MGQGSNLGATYEEVKAYQAKSGIIGYAAGSDGREPTGGLYVLWDRDGGFTNSGWHFDNAASPAFGYTEEAIHAEIDANQNLNDMFSKWKDKVPNFEDRYNFMLDTLPNHCIEE